MSCPAKRTKSTGAGEDDEDNGKVSSCLCISGDFKILDALLPANEGERRALADIIFSKLDDMESGTTVIRLWESQARYTLLEIRCVY